MCCADTTVEPAQEQYKGVWWAINGWGVEHRECKKWDKVVDMVTVFGP
jgi:hypothetical protein